MAGRFRAQFSSLWVQFLRKSGLNFFTFMTEYIKFSHLTGLRHAVAAAVRVPVLCSLRCRLLWRSAPVTSGSLRGDRIPRDPSIDHVVPDHGRPRVCVPDYGRPRVCAARPSPPARGPVPAFLHMLCVLRLLHLCDLGPQNSWAQHRFSTPRNDRSSPVKEVPSAMVL